MEAVEDFTAEVEDFTEAAEVVSTEVAAASTAAVVVDTMLTAAALEVGRQPHHAWAAARTRDPADTRLVRTAILATQAHTEPARAAREV